MASQSSIFPQTLKPRVKPRVIVLFGPTASGKSALAIKLAQALNGEIINADSRQTYKGLPILTACPTAADYATIPHHLYEFLSPTERFSAADYMKKAIETIEEVLKKGKTTIVVGGTGFYLKALMGGLSPIPASDKALEAEIAALTPTERHKQLAQADPQTAAKLHPNDTQRTIRALTVWKQTGNPLSEWQKGGAEAESPYAFFKIGLNPPRPVLHENLRRRWEEVMPAQGVVTESKTLAAQGFTGTEAGLGGLAIPLWISHARTGQPSLAEVTQKALEADRQYAKRQYTWLKNSYKPDLMLESPDIQLVLEALKA